MATRMGGFSKSGPSQASAWSLYALTTFLAASVWSVGFLTTPNCFGLFLAAAGAASMSFYGMVLSRGPGDKAAGDQRVTGLGISSLMLIAVTVILGIVAMTGLFASSAPAIAFLLILVGLAMNAASNAIVAPRFGVSRKTAWASTLLQTAVFVTAIACLGTGPWLLLLAALAWIAALFHHVRRSSIVKNESAQ